VLGPPDWDRHTDETYLSQAAESLSHDVLLALVKEFQATETHLAELNTQRRALGIPDKPRTT